MTTIDQPQSIVGLTERALRILAEGCQHNYLGRCWLCSDERPEWYEMRRAMGLPAYPPNNPPLRYRRWRRR